MEECVFKQIEANLSSSIKMKLDNIRRYLAYGNASVMVGAGFSRNAEMDETVSMKDWNSLSKVFYQKLYSRTPTGDDLAFKTPMRLASLVETSFGRTELDKMIYESLPDERIAPGDIHKAFLNLKWKDVFTTNYDRLLEKAAIDSEQEPIINKVNAILSVKYSNPSADTSALELDIDHLVYQLYCLTEDETKIVEEAD